MSPSGPTVFNGRYELHRRLGRGGMAEVSLARDQLLDRPVAIKVLFPEFATDPAFVERFRREATAAANLNPRPRDYTDKAWQASVGAAEIRKTILEGGLAVGKSPIMPAQPQLADKPDIVTELVRLIRGFAH